MMMMMMKTRVEIDCLMMVPFPFSLFRVSTFHARPASCRWFKLSGGADGVQIKAPCVAAVKAAASFISLPRSTATRRCDWLGGPALIYTGVSTRV